MDAIFPFRHFSGSIIVAVVGSPEPTRLERKILEALDAHIPLLECPEKDS
jgi:hypothetical protein